MINTTRATSRSVQLFFRFCSGKSNSPVTGVRSNHVFEEQNLFKYLASSGIEGFSSPDKVSVKQFSHGQSNPTFMVTSSEGKKFTVRKQPPGSLLPGAHAVDREYAVMTALKKSNVPIPTTRLFCDDKSIIGSPFFVYGDYTLLCGGISC
jgi:acyl-CoA dehydrogenase family member 10